MSNKAIVATLHNSVSHLSDLLSQGWKSETEIRDRMAVVSNVITDNVKRPELLEEWSKRSNEFLLTTDEVVVLKTKFLCKPPALAKLEMQLKWAEQVMAYGRYSLATEHMHA